MRKCFRAQKEKWRKDREELRSSLLLRTILEGKVKEMEREVEEEEQERRRKRVKRRKR